MAHFGAKMNFLNKLGSASFYRFYNYLISGTKTDSLFMILIHYPQVRITEIFLTNYFEKVTCEVHSEASLREVANIHIVSRNFSSSWDLIPDLNWKQNSFKDFKISTKKTFFNNVAFCCTISWSLYHITYTSKETLTMVTKNDIFNLQI